MRLQELFRPEDVLVGFHAQDKWTAIEDMVDHLRDAGRLPQDSWEPLLEAVLQRERSMSTGMEHGIAIPHAAVDRLEEVVACMAIVAGEGLNFESIDASPTRLVVLLLIPRAQKLLHIRTLADVARVLGEEDVRHALTEAPTSAAAWAVLGEAQ